MAKTSTPAATKTETKAAKVAANGHAKVATAPKEKARAPRSIWTEKRIAVVKALRVLKADATHPKEAQAIADKSGLTLAEIKHYLYKDQALVSEGYVAIQTSKDEPPVRVYSLTAKGQKVEMV